jgi:hypothetical protein
MPLRDIRSRETPPCLPRLLRPATGDSAGQSEAAGDLSIPGLFRVPRRGPASISERDRAVATTLVEV